MPSRSLRSAIWGAVRITWAANPGLTLGFVALAVLRRIALVRAFGRDCPILLLDEPTAQLDGAAIQGFMRQLRDLARGRTILLISQGLETRAERLAPADSGPPLFTREV